MATRRDNRGSMTLHDLRDHLEEVAPMPADADEAKSAEVRQRRYEIAEGLGFNKLEVLRSRLADWWEPTTPRRVKR